MVVHTFPIGSSTPPSTLAWDTLHIKKEPNRNTSTRVRNAEESAVSGPAHGRKTRVWGIETSLLSQGRDRRGRGCRNIPGPEKERINHENQSDLPHSADDAYR